MLKFTQLLLLSLLVHTSSFSQAVNTLVRFFNTSYQEITEDEFDNLLATFSYLEVPGDSIHHRTLTAREVRGQITDRPALQTLLENATIQTLDASKPIVIIYYPGKDPCNSTGTTNRGIIKNSYQELEDGIYQVAQVKPIYLYKDSEGLKKYRGIITWYQDPLGTIERTFFEHHYPCSSFVVIGKNGDYISYFGEFSKDQLWTATHLLNK